MTETAHNPDPIHQEALRLAAHGLHILPIKPGHKRPPMTAWQNAATTDPRTVDNWYTGLYRGHGIGIATGHQGLFVLDIDEHHPEASGHDTLEQLVAEHGPLPDTWQVHTGSGGTHYYLRSPIPITNDAGRKLGPGIDIRGIGGQVLAPPTIHPNGQPYTWIIGHEPDDLPLADAPLWLLKLLKPEPQPSTGTPQFTKPRNHDLWDELDDSPAAYYNNNHTWNELLSIDGWRLDHTSSNGEEHWTRPGKDNGTSATLGYQGRDALTVFTSSLPWLPEGTYSRFGYYACRHHNGDRSAAARAIRTEISNTITLPPTEQLCNGDEWPDPIPLTEHTTVPPFPLDVLPTWIADHAHQIADDLQVAIDLPATLALGALSVAAIGKAKVTYPRQRWTQPLNLYTAVALPPSAGKSPAKSAMFGALEQLELRRLEQAAHARAQADTQRRVLEKRQRNLEDKAAKGGDDGRAAEFELADLVIELARLDRTPSGRLLVDDTTTEALGVALADAGGNIAVVSSEGGVFDRIAGLYNDGVANFDLYLEAWSGGRYVVDRIKRDSIQIPSANLVVVTTIQPTTLDEIGARRQFAGRGLTARFLLTLPESNVGIRDRLRPTSGDEHTRRTYDAHLTDLADRIHTNGSHLTIDDDASLHFARWDQSLEDRLAVGEDLEHLAEWVGKLRANVLRLAALLHLAHRRPGDHIDIDTMREAIRLGDYYLGHMTAIADRWGVDEGIVKAKKVMQWAARTNTDEFTVRDLMRNNRRLFDQAEDVLPVLATLIEHGYVRPLFDGPIALGRRGKEPQRFAVHPNPGEMSRNVARPEPVDNHPQMSRMSRMSRKGGNEHPSLSQTETHSQPPNPGDKRDMRDISTQPDPTQPDDPTGLFN